MRAWLSVETACSTAAISSASGGRGMYSLAPALIARTAASASLPMPQATIGTKMRSCFRLSIIRAMSSFTSIISRSAPWPERSALRPWSISSAWATVAPRLSAILPAVLKWPSSGPRIRRRMVLFLYTSRLTIGLDDFRHGHAETLIDDDDFAACHEPVVDVDVDRF